MALQIQKRFEKIFKKSFYQIFFIRFPKECEKEKQMAGRLIQEGLSESLKEGGAVGLLLLPTLAESLQNGIGFNKKNLNKLGLQNKKSDFSAT